MSASDHEPHGYQNSPAAKPGSRQELAKIGRARSRLLVCFYTFPLYAVALVLLLNEGRRITSFMIVYMTIYAVFAINMINLRCPSCKEQFFVKSFLFNPLARKCVHCGLSIKPLGDESTTRRERLF